MNPSARNQHLYCSQNARTGFQGEHRLTVGLTFLAAALALLPAQGSLAQIGKIAKLNNEPILVNAPDDPLVAYKIAFQVGSQNDPPGKEGLAYLTATLMAEGGTKNNTYPEILKLLEPMAAGYNASVDRELATFSGRVHKDNVEQFCYLLLDAITQPAFVESDFVRIKQRTVDGIEKNLRYSNDEELGKAVFCDTVFTGTPYAHPVQGTVAGLQSITLDDVKQFYARNFTRENLLLGVGGGYSIANVAMLNVHLSQFDLGRPAPVPVSKPQAITGRKVVLVKKPGAATAISFGFPISLLRGSREFYALWVANSWLGEHRSSSSHLYQVIREARGMNYGDYSYIEAYPGGGGRMMPPTGVPRRQQLFEVWIRPVPNAQAHFALRAAMRELEKLYTNGLTKEQFELKRTFISKYCLHFAESNFDRLGYAIDDRIYGVPAPGHLAQFRKIVPTLTLEEVNAAIKKYLNPENAVIVMINQDADQLADALATEAKSSISYATPKPKEVLEEDKIIEVYPLRIKRENITIVLVEQVFSK